MGRSDRGRDRALQGRLSFLAPSANHVFHANLPCSVDRVCANGLVDTESFVSASLYRVMFIARSLARDRHFNVEHWIKGVLANPRHGIVAPQSHPTAIALDGCKRIELLEPLGTQKLHGNLVVLKPGGVVWATTPS